MAKLIAIYRLFRLVLQFMNIRPYGSRRSRCRVLFCLDFKLWRSSDSKFPTWKFPVWILCEFHWIFSVGIGSIMCSFPLSNNLLVTSLAGFYRMPPVRPSETWMAFSECCSPVLLSPTVHQLDPIWNLQSGSKGIQIKQLFWLSRLAGCSPKNKSKKSLKWVSNSIGCCNQNCQTPNYSITESVKPTYPISVLSQTDLCSLMASDNLIPTDKPRFWWAWIDPSLRSKANNSVQNLGIC